MFKAIAHGFILGLKYSIFAMIDESRPFFAENLFNESSGVLPINSVSDCAIAIIQFLFLLAQNYTILTNLIIT